VANSRMMAITVSAIPSMGKVSAAPAIPRPVSVSRIFLKVMFVLLAVPLGAVRCFGEVRIYISDPMTPTIHEM